MRIGELSKQSGFSRDTIRYYEKVGLLPVASHTPRLSAYKNYGHSSLARLTQIRQLKDIGFSLREIRQLVNATASNACADLPSVLAQKLHTIDEHIARLSRFKNALVAMKSACSGDCETRNGMPTCVPSPLKNEQAARCC